MRTFLDTIVFFTFSAMMLSPSSTESNFDKQIIQEKQKTKQKEVLLNQTIKTLEEELIKNELEICKRKNI